MGDNTMVPPPPQCEGPGAGEFMGATTKDVGEPEAKRMRVAGAFGEDRGSPPAAPHGNDHPRDEQARAPATQAERIPTEHAVARPSDGVPPQKPPGNVASTRAPDAPKPKAGKRGRANMSPGEGMYGWGAYLPGQPFPPGPMHPWLGPGLAMPQMSPAAGSTKKGQALHYQQQQMAMWHYQQEYASRMAGWQPPPPQQLLPPQQQHKPAAGPRIPTATLQATLAKAKKVFNKVVTGEPDSPAHALATGFPLSSPGKDPRQDSMHAASVMQQPGDGAAAHTEGMEGLGLESQMPSKGWKALKIFDRLEDAHEDPEKLERFILECLHEQPTILAAAVDSDFGQSIRQATVMKAVHEARPMLNLLVGVLSKYVPVDAWNKEVRPMCEQLQSIFGRPGLFCGHAQGAKELKAAELVRNPPENSSQRKGRDGRTPKGEGEGVISMYGKRLMQSCRCDSSKCLKMYCTCFRNETRCNSSCVCMECHNDGLHEEERMAAARMYASQIKKPRVEATKLQQQAALLNATQQPKKPDKERKRRGRAYTKSQIKLAMKFVYEYEKRLDAGDPAGDREGYKCRDIPRTGTFENEETWTSFCSLTGEVNHRAINLWDRVQRDMKKAAATKQMPPAVRAFSLCVCLSLCHSRAFALFPCLTVARARALFPMPCGASAVGAHTRICLLCLSRSALTHSSLKSSRRP